MPSKADAVKTKFPMQLESRSRAHGGDRGIARWLRSWRSAGCCDWPMRPAGRDRNAAFWPNSFDRARHLVGLSAYRRAERLLRARRHQARTHSDPRRHRQNGGGAGGRRRRRDADRHALPDPGGAARLGRDWHSQRDRQSDLQPDREAGDRELCRSQGQGARAVTAGRYDLDLDAQASGAQGACKPATTRSKSWSARRCGSIACAAANAMACRSASPTT